MHCQKMPCSGPRRRQRAPNKWTGEVIEVRSGMEGVDNSYPFISSIVACSHPFTTRAHPLYRFTNQQRRSKNRVSSLYLHGRRRSSPTPKPIKALVPQITRTRGFSGLTLLQPCCFHGFSHTGRLHTGRLHPAAVSSFSGLLRPGLGQKMTNPFGHKKLHIETAELQDLL